MAKRITLRQLNIEVNALSRKVKDTKKEISTIVSNIEKGVEKDNLRERLEAADANLVKIRKQTSALAKDIAEFKKANKKK